MAVTSASSSSQNLGNVLGLRGTAIVWGRVLAFAVAWMLCDVPSVLFFTLRTGNGPARSFWLVELFSALLLTALVVICFRNIRDDIGAALLAAIAYTLLAPWLQLFMRPFFGFGSLAALSAFAPNLSALFVLLGLALALRSLHPRWLALWAGSLGGFVVSYFFSLALSLAILARARAAHTMVAVNPEALAACLITATVFTLLFEVLSGMLDGRA